MNRHATKALLLKAFKHGGQAPRSSLKENKPKLPKPANMEQTDELAAPPSVSLCFNAKLSFDSETLSEEPSSTGQLLDNGLEKALLAEPSALLEEHASFVNPVLLWPICEGGTMSDLSGYKDLSKAPFLGDESDSESSSYGAATATLFSSAPATTPAASPSRTPSLNPNFISSPSKVPHLSLDNMATESKPPMDTEISGNVQTLIRLVSDLPEGVTKQNGAQIIRLTMEAMGIPMEDVLSEAQSSQSELLDAVRTNLKKIEEFKAIIRKLESDIKYYQGKANELSEIIDLFIMSSPTSQQGHLVGSEIG